VKYYYAIVHKDPGSAYGAEFPDLPGCFSAADDMESLLANAVTAVELWMEDAESVPEARDVEAIREVAGDALADGAFLLAVPYIRRGGRPVRANISLDRGMLDAIDKAAAALNLTRSAFLAEAARNEIEGRHLASQA
jgi:predicted RNase H-like HicB family nuclease